MGTKARGLGGPREWLRYARSDLALAQQRRSRDVLRATLCFHAQQAAEKALKAVLVSKRVAFPFQHNLAHLVSLVEDAGIAWPDELDAVVELTQYAVESRYPCLATPRRGLCGAHCALPQPFSVGRKRQSSTDREHASDSGPRTTGDTRRGQVSGTCGTRLPKPARPERVACGLPKAVRAGTRLGWVGRKVIPQPLRDYGSLLARESAWAPAYLFVSSPDHPFTRSPDVSGRRSQLYPIVLHCLPRVV